MKLNKMFTSHMVFAGHIPIRVYGEGCGVVHIQFADYQQTLISHEDSWLIEFPPMEYGGPYSMKVTFEEETVVLEDIYIGEVFLFAGQSNMQFKLKESNTSPNLYCSNSKLRLYSTDRIEQTDFYTADDGWAPCEQDRAGDWSALAYLAGNEISKTHDIAVGIIVCYQGASVIESWVPKGTFEKHNIQIPDNQKFIDHATAEYRKWNDDGTLYSYALSQIIPYALSAVVWYQGESDASEAEGRVYCDELSALIDVWRNDFGNPNLPFVIVQLADNLERAGIGWELIQKAQMEIQSKRPFVTTVVSADICENDAIHPPTKDKLAQRIAKVLLG